MSTTSLIDRRPRRLRRARTAAAVQAVENESANHKKTYLNLNLNLINRPRCSWQGKVGVTRVRLVLRANRAADRGRRGGAGLAKLWPRCRALH
jgi:hypothetical protein